MTVLLILLILAALVTLTVLFPTVMLILFAVLIALILLLLFLRPIVDIRYEEELKVTLKILFLKIPLAPKKEKPLKLSDFRIDRFRRKRRKEQRKYLYNKLKKKALLKKKAEQSVAEEKDEKPKRSLRENVAFVLDLIKLVVLRAMRKFGRYFRIDLYYLHVCVGGAEPDKTALTYGAITQSVSYLTELLDRHTNTHYPGKRDPRVYVGADFLAEKTTLKAHLAFSIRVWQVLAVGLSALIGYLKMPKHEPKAAKEDQEKTVVPLGQPRGDHKRK